MNPFEDLHTKSRKWELNDEGIDLRYDADFLSQDDADRLFAALKIEVAWRRVVVNTPGGPQTVPRMVSWHADPGLTYKYSGLTHPWQEWTPALAEIRGRLAAKLNRKFNGCLANFYENERDSVSMHADDEEDMASDASIASVSLGHVREFVVKHVDTGSRHVIPLEHGSLLLMSGRTQEVSRHGIPKSRRPCNPRINLTFRRTLSQ